MCTGHPHAHLFLTIITVNDAMEDESSSFESCAYLKFAEKLFD